MLVAECDSEQAAAKVLGYDEVSWDNWSGQERLPVPARLPWGNLIFVQKKAAKMLGYKQATWNMRQSASTQPDSFNKHWSELTACGEYEIVCISHFWQPIVCCVSMPSISMST